MDISEFLLARIAEDEAAAREALGRHRWVQGRYPGTTYEHIARHDPARVLAECKAHRAIVTRYGVPDPHRPAERCTDCDTLYDLAAVFADHPDYQDVWRS